MYDDDTNIYKTVDLPFAAYLCMKGYTLLGTVDAKNPDDPKQVYFVLTHEKEEDRKLMKSQIFEWRETWNVNPFKIYFTKVRFCRKEALNPQRSV